MKCLFYKEMKTREGFISSKPELQVSRKKLAQQVLTLPEFKAFHHFSFFVCLF